MLWLIGEAEVHLSWRRALFAIYAIRDPRLGSYEMPHWQQRLGRLLYMYT